MRRRFVVWGLVLLGGLGAGQACGGPQPLGGAGETCFRAADCKEGLVCIEGRCSSALNEIGGDVTGPEERPPGAAGSTAGDGGSPNTGGAASGGSASGGAASGGAASGGSSSGGAASGGTGGAASGGAASGGTGGSGFAGAAP